MNSKNIRIPVVIVYVRCWLVLLVVVCRYMLRGTIKRKDLPDRPEAEQSSQLILPGHSSLILMSGPHDQSPGVCKGEGALLRGVPWVKGRLS